MSATERRNGPRPRSLAERFHEKYEKGDGCWHWNAARNDAGYGILGTGPRGRVKVRAHRLALELSGTRIPAGAVVRHLCNTPSCVRPDHLAVGTQAQNVLDMLQGERNARGEAHPNHVLTEDGVLVIRARYASGESCRAIGSALGVSRATVHDVIAGRTWNHVRHEHEATR